MTQLGILRILPTWDSAPGKGVNGTGLVIFSWCQASSTPSSWSQQTAGPGAPGSSEWRGYSERLQVSSHLLLPTSPGADLVPREPCPGTHISGLPCQLPTRQQGEPCPDMPVSPAHPRVASSSSRLIPCWDLPPWHPRLTWPSQESQTTEKGIYYWGTIESL